MSFPGGHGEDPGGGDIPFHLTEEYRQRQLEAARNQHHAYQVLGGNHAAYDPQAGGDPAAAYRGHPHAYRPPWEGQPPPGQHGAMARMPYPPYDPRFGPPPGYPGQPYGHDVRLPPHADPRFAHPYGAPYGHEQPGGPRGPPPGYPRDGAPGSLGGPPMAGYPHVPKSPGSQHPSKDVSSPKTKMETSTPGSQDSDDDDDESPTSSPKSPTGPPSHMGRKNLPVHRQVDNKILDESGEHVWYAGSVPLGLADDKYWLSELQVYLRSNFAEAFGATEDDIAAPMHGRNKPIVLGQVGIRCMHCKHDNPAERGQQATSYPSQISGIYNSVQQMLRLHLDCCLSMPAPVRSRIEQLRLSCSSRGGRKQYWVDSAKRLGLVDTPHGIHFGRDPTGPLPPLSGPSVNYKESRKKKLALKAEAEKKREDKKAAKEQEAKDAAAAIPLERPQQPPVDSRPLVFPDDKPLISDYLYLTLEQMAPCTLMEADRVGCYKTRAVGFPGLACKHCVGQAGCGRYFPASEASLSQTTTSQTIMNHVRNCRRCPIEIRENLEIMKRNRMGPDGKRADKPKHGGRKVFFHRLWCRIQGIPFEESKAATKEPKKKKLYKKPGPVPKGKKKGKSGEFDSDTDTEDEASVGSDNEAAKVKSEQTEDAEELEEDSKPKAKPKSGPGLSKRKAMSPWYEGCVRLAKSDDKSWCSKIETFARDDLVEAFSLKKNDSLDGYSGDKDPAVGQVGIRCVFCKHVDPSERSSGCIAFPDMLSSIHTRVGEMIKNHFVNCPSLPEEQRQQFDKLINEGETEDKSGGEDCEQYWVDSARDIGLANVPPEGIGSPGSWGVTFRRDPLQPSPADELDLENADDASWGKNLMVRPQDRGLCTDHVLLMLCQVRPCRFRKSDRRAGPGSRGRDRAMGFPGLACMHCANKNSLGRYFPVSAKNLTDNTANSLQAHISACSRCPEHIQASLAYLSHRSILQKAELSGSWKKAFFRKVWDRLHTERSWTAIEDEENFGEEEYDSDDNVTGKYAEQDEEGEGGAAAEAEGDNDSDEEGSEGEEGKEEVPDQMNALIKAAAIWLTEQDQADDPKGKRSPKKRGAKQAAAKDSGSKGTSKRPRRGGS